MNLYFMEKYVFNLIYFICPYMRGWGKTEQKLEA